MLIYLLRPWVFFDWIGSFAIKYSCQPQRMHLDKWDKAIMERNELLTGHPYGQSVRPHFL
jgi:hypothetical protein